MEGRRFPLHSTDPSGVEHRFGWEAEPDEIAFPETWYGRVVS